LLREVPEDDGEKPDETAEILEVLKKVQAQKMKERLETAEGKPVNVAAVDSSSGIQKKIVDVLRSLDSGVSLEAVDGINKVEPTGLEKLLAASQVEGSKGHVEYIGEVMEGNDEEDVDETQGSTVEFTEALQVEGSSDDSQAEEDATTADVKEDSVVDSGFVEDTQNRGLVSASESSDFAGRDSISDEDAISISDDVNLSNVEEQKLVEVPDPMNKETTSNDEAPASEENSAPEPVTDPIVGRDTVETPTDPEPTLNLPRFGAVSNTSKDDNQTQQPAGISDTSGDGRTLDDLISPMVSAHPRSMSMAGPALAEKLADDLQWYEPFLRSVPYSVLHCPLPSYASLLSRGGLVIAP